MVNVAVFVSGGGTNCENIIRYFAGSDKVNIALVVSSSSKAYAIERAKGLGVPVEVVTRSGFADQEAVDALLRKYSIDFIVLAGFLVVVPEYLVKECEGRMINIHPALLPKFGGPGMYGHHVHEAVKRAGETETGMTVHWVSDKVDGGEIIARFRTPIDPADSPDDIAAKEHVLEMAHFPRVIEQVLVSVYEE